MNDPFLTFHPPLPWRQLLASEHPDFEAALPGRPHFFEYSRDALHWAFRALRATRPELRSAWMPSFHCGMEVRAAVDAGWEPRFYPVRIGAGGLVTDLEALAEGLRDDPGPVLGIHYFGLPDVGIEELRRLCDRHGVALVEDVSHGLCSHHRGQPLGSFGSIATFSPYKSLGTLDGGLLTYDRPSLEALGHAPFAEPVPGPRRLWTADACFEGLRRGLHGPQWLRRRRHRLYTSPDPAAFEARVERSRGRIFDTPRNYGAGISRLSERLVRATDPRQIVDRRRSRWARLDRRLRAFEGYRPLVESGELAEGVCPLYLPIFVRERQRLWLELEARHIRPFVFGYFHHPALSRGLDPASFPEAELLRRELLCLPIHPALRDADIDHLASVVGELLSRDGQYELYI